MPGEGKEVVVGIFGVDAALDGVPAQLDVFLLEGQLLAGGDVQLQMHEVEAGYKLRNRVLHLQSGVHLQEVEIALLVDKELDGPGVEIVRGFAHANSDFAHAAAHIFIDDWRRRFFQHFLMPALYRALTLAEVDDVAMLVAENLHLDVPGVDDQLFDVDFVVAEGALRFAARGLVRRM